MTKLSRIHYLDSIRGIAALMVVVYHYIGWKWKDEVAYKAAAFVFNGSDAVSFFFVLSGFVLSYSYIHTDRKIKVGNYVYKRILRLYPAYILNILILYFYVNRNSLSGSTLYNSFVLGKSPHVQKELLMVFNAHNLYLPGWTLQVEMIYSLIVLVLVWVFRKYKPLLMLFFVGSFFIGSPGLRLYMTHFIYGIVFAYFYPQLIKIDFRKSKFYPYRWLIYLAIFVLFSLRNINNVTTPLFKQIFDTMWSYHIRWEHFSGLAALMILTLVAMNKPIQKVLENKVLLYLGKISYSIYLIHWIFVLIIMEYWHLWARVLGDGYLRFYTMFAVLIGGSIAMAHLMYHWVELPAINFSKKRSRITKTPS